MWGRGGACGGDDRMSSVPGRSALRRVGRCERRKARPAPFCDDAAPHYDGDALKARMARNARGSGRPQRPLQNPCAAGSRPASARTVPSRQAVRSDR